MHLIQVIREDYRHSTLPLCSSTTLVSQKVHGRHDGEVAYRLHSKLLRGNVIVCALDAPAWSHGPPPTLLFTVLIHLGGNRSSIIFKIEIFQCNQNLICHIHMLIQNRSQEVCHGPHCSPSMESLCAWQLEVSLANPARILAPNVVRGLLLMVCSLFLAGSSELARRQGWD